MKFINDMLTGIDNKTYDLGRVAWLLGFLVFLGLALYSIVWKGVAFDMQTYAIAVGLMVTALGAALNLKSKTEPPQEPPK